MRKRKSEMKTNQDERTEKEKTTEKVLFILLKKGRQRSGMKKGHAW